MAKTETIPWDSAAYLKTDKDIANYLEAVFEDGDPALIAHGLGVVARAKGMSQVAQAAGLGRESLYKALSNFWCGLTGPSAQVEAGNDGPSCPDRHLNSACRPRRAFSCFAAPA